MVSVVLTVVTAILSSLAATLSTALIERFGGVIGGVIASSPTTIIPFAIAVAIAADGNSQQVITAAYTVPIGLLANNFFLTFWAATTRISDDVRCVGRYGLAALIPLSLAVWAAAATAIIFSTNSLRQIIPIRVIGVSALCVSLFVGVTLLFSRRAPQPRAHKAVTAATYLLRGVLAGATIAVAVLLTMTDSVVASVASVFPAITATALYSLHYEHGAAVSQSIVSPIMLGNTSVSVFALVFGECIVAFSGNEAASALQLTSAALIADATAIIGASLPMFALCRYRAAQYAAATAAVSVSVSDAEFIELSGA